MSCSEMIYIPPAVLLMQNYSFAFQIQWSVAGNLTLEAG